MLRLYLTELPILILISASLFGLAGCKTWPILTEAAAMARTAPSVRGEGNARELAQPVSAGAQTPPIDQAQPIATNPDELGAPRFSISEEHLAFMRDPPDTMLRTLLTAERDSRTGNWRLVPKVRPGPDDRVPSLAGVGYEGTDSRVVVIPDLQIASCVYGNTTLFFWYSRRPPLQAAAIAGVPLRYPPMADVAIRQCPDRLGDALQLAVGPNAGARIAAAQTAKRARDEQRNRDDDARREAARASRERWKDGATALAPERVTTLWTSIDRVLKAEEAQNTRILDRPASSMSPSTEAFFARMQREFYPPLLELSRGAWAQGRAIQAGEAGRGGFEQWDRGAGGMAMNAIGRLQRLWPVGWWHVGLVGKIDADLASIYTDQLGDKGIFDPSTRSRVMEALARRRVAPAARVEPPLALATAPAPTRIVFLRPGELAAYRVGQDIAIGLNGLAQSAAKAGQVRQLVGDLDKRLGSSRSAFWSCWATRCPSVGDRWVEYSQALREKDWYYLSQELIDTANHAFHGSRGAQMTELFQALAGLREIDGGLPRSCIHSFERLTVLGQEFVQKKLTRNPFDFGAIAGFSEELLGSDEQRNYQACRDTSEMAKRSRK